MNLNHGAKDESGNIYGKLTVLNRSGSDGKLACWNCQCACGEMKRVIGCRLRSGNTTSCGCMLRERAVTNGRRNIKHGLAVGGKPTPEYKLWVAARCRSKRSGIEFTIKPQDIRIPQFCPLLGIPLISGRKRHKFDSPSLDRLDSKLGYTPDNIWVISFRANSWKSNFTLTELRNMVTILERRMS